MQLNIKALAALAPGLDTPEQWQHWASEQHTAAFTQADVDVPKLTFIPMMQRRRLSKFARLCFYTLNQLTPTTGSAIDSATDSKEEQKTDTQIVFASRFGDLQKTTELIDNVAEQAPLSPAQFGLSVHNAVAGQYSLFTNNKRPSTTISAGADSFHMGLIEAISRLEQSDDDELLMVCTETITPDVYAPYINHLQVDHCVALLLSKTQGQRVWLNLSASTDSSTDKPDQPLPHALQFMAWYYGAQTSTDIKGDRHLWQWQK